MPFKEVQLDKWKWEKYECKELKKLQKKDYLYLKNAKKDIEEIIDKNLFVINKQRLRLLVAIDT